MKKILAALAIAIALPATVLADDINPGALQLSGRSGAAFLSETRKAGSLEDKSSSINAELSAMYYISKFLGIGLGTSYNKFSPDGGTASSAFVFGPKAGLDYSIMRHLSVAADATVGVAQMKVGSVSGSGYGLEIGAGFKLFLNQNVSFDVMGVYKRATADVSGVTMTDSTAGAMIGFSLYLTNTPVNADFNRDYSGREYPR